MSPVCWADLINTTYNTNNKPLPIDAKIRGVVSTYFCDKITAIHKVGKELFW